MVVSGVWYSLHQYLVLSSKTWTYCPPIGQVRPHRVGGPLSTGEAVIDWAGGRAVLRRSSTTRSGDRRDFDIKNVRAVDPLDGST